MLRKIGCLNDMQYSEKWKVHGPRNKKYLGSTIFRHIKTGGKKATYSKVCPICYHLHEGEYIYH